MVVDFHAHLAPADPGAPPFLRHLFDVDGYLEQQSAAGIDLTVLSYALADLEGGPGELDEAKRQHAFLADLCARHAGRFAALASVDPFGGGDWLDEAGRMLDSGFRGLCLPTSNRGRYLDADEAQDALAFANERGVVVLLHPSDQPIEAERSGDPILRDWIGRPYDTGLCVSRLLLADTLSRHPALRLVVVHSGGPVPMFLGRLDSLHETFTRRAAFAGGGPPGGGPPFGPPSGGPPGGGPPGGGPPGGPGSFGPPGGAPSGGGQGGGAALRPALGDTLPSERAARLYFDTASYHPVSIRAAIETAGIDHVVLGTDFPPAGTSPRPAVDVIHRLGLADDERDKILFENAQRLLEPMRQPAAPAST